jgi:hypothetical protein
MSKRGNMDKDTVETLRLAVEGQHKAKARYREKIFIREPHEGKLVWEGDVFIFDLSYDTKNDTATKEQIAEWRLPKPTAKALEAAENRGLKIKKALQTSHPLNAEAKRRAKMAYAFSSGGKGKSKPKIHAVLHEGPVKSPADAVKKVI